MNNKTFLAITATVAAMTLTARADFFDNFDSYTSQANFNATWAVDTGTAGILSWESTTSFSAPDAISQSTTVATRLWTSLGSTVQGNVLDFSYEFYATANSTRDFAQVYSRAGTAWTSGLNGTIRMGTYNTTAAGRFAACFSQATPANGAIYGDGATIISTSDTTGWFALAGTRTTGWHKMEVVGATDPNHTGKDIYKFYVDGTLEGSIANAADDAFGFGVLGGAVSTGTGSAVNMAYYDDFSVATVVVPEPSSVALSLLGGFGLTAAAVSRRRKT